MDETHGSIAAGRTKQKSGNTGELRRVGLATGRMQGEWGGMVREGVRSGLGVTGVGCEAPAQRSGSVRHVVVLGVGVQKAT